MFTRLGGRSLNQNDLAEIRLVTADHWDQGRTAITRILCQQWQWRQPNAQLKDMACGSLLLALEKKGELSLPPRLQETFRHPRRADRRAYVIDSTELTGPVSAFGSLTIKMVRQTSDEGLWDYLVDRHHCLGSPWIVGSYLRYLACLAVARWPASAGTPQLGKRRPATGESAGANEQRASNLAGRSTTSVSWCCPGS